MEHARSSLIQVKEHVQSVFQFCDTIKNQTWYGMTDCLSFRPYVKNKIRYLERLKNIVSDYVTDESNSSRKKRAVLDFVGKISKILFGTLDYDDSVYYTNKITELEQEQKDFLRISKEQLLVIKSAVISFNSTIRDVNKNEKVLKDGLYKLNSHVNKISNFLNNEMQTLALISEHIIQIERVMTECKEIFELIIDALIHSQDGAIQPQIITPMQIKGILKDEHSVMGLDYPVNFPSQDLMKIITPQIYLQGQYLVYVLKVPLLIPEQFQLYEIIPFPAPANLFNKSSSKHLYIDSAKDFIISDAVHQRFAKMTRYQVERCFELNEMRYVCKEEFPILTYKNGDDCEATLLHPSTTEVPNSCTHRMIEIKDTLWIKLLGNEWLHVSPREEVFTILCNKAESITLKGRGRIQMKPGCKAYGSYAMVYSYSTFTRNVTFPDIIPYAPIDIDCLLSTSKQSYLEEIQLNLPINNVLSHSDDLRLTSHKIEEVDDLINNERWKMDHSFKLNYTSWAAVLGALIFALITAVCCGCCYCKCCRKLGLYTWDRCQTMDCKETMKRHCMLQQTIHTGNVHYHGSTVSLPINTRETESLTAIDDNMVSTREEQRSNTDIVAKRTRSSRTKNTHSTWRR